MRWRRNKELGLYDFAGKLSLICFIFFSAYTYDCAWPRKKKKYSLKVVAVRLGGVDVFVFGVDFWKFDIHFKIYERKSEILTYAT